MARQHVLIIDADSSSRRLLEVSLKKAGYQVTPACDGDEALALLEHADPDLILAETQLPGQDGFALCSTIKAQPKRQSVPFVFLTAATSLDDKIRGLELGADDYLVKPVYIKEVTSRIAALLQRRDRLQLERETAARTKFTGQLADIAVVDLLQTIQISGKSGVVGVRSECGHGSMWFTDGKVIDAECGKLRAAIAVYRLLTWSTGAFEVEFLPVDRTSKIPDTTQGLLMEGLRRLDEWGRLLEQLPPLTSRLHVVDDRLHTRVEPLTANQRALIARFDGTRSLQEIVDASGLDDLVALGSISTLYFDGLIASPDPLEDPVVMALGSSDADSTSSPGVWMAKHEPFAAATSSAAASDGAPSAPPASTPDPGRDYTTWPELEGFALEHDAGSETDHASSADGAHSTSPDANERLKSTAHDNDLDDANVVQKLERPTTDPWAPAGPVGADGQPSPHEPDAQLKSSGGERSVPDRQVASDDLGHPLAAEGADRKKTRQGTAGFVADGRPAAMEVAESTPPIPGSRVDDSPGALEPVEEPNAIRGDATSLDESLRVDAYVDSPSPAGPRTTNGTGGPASDAQESQTELGVESRAAVVASEKRVAAAVDAETPSAAWSHENAPREPSSPTTLKFAPIDEPEAVERSELVLHQEQVHEREMYDAIASSPAPAWPRFRPSDTDWPAPQPGTTAVPLLPAGEMTRTKATPEELSRPPNELEQAAATSTFDDVPTLERADSSTIATRLVSHEGVIQPPMGMARAYAAGSLDTKPTTAASRLAGTNTRTHATGSAHPAQSQVNLVPTADEDFARLREVAFAGEADGTHPSADPPAETPNWATSPEMPTEPSHRPNAPSPMSQERPMAHVAGVEFGDAAQLPAAVQTRASGPRSCLQPPSTATETQALVPTRQALMAYEPSNAPVLIRAGRNLVLTIVGGLGALVLVWSARMLTPASKQEPQATAAERVVRNTEEEPPTARPKLVERHSTPQVAGGPSPVRATPSNPSASLASASQHSTATTHAQAQAIESEYLAVEELFRARKLDEARQRTHAIIESAPQHAGAHLLVAKIALERAELQAALEAARRAAELDPSLAEAHLSLGVAHDALGASGEAISAYQRFLDLDPENAYVATIAKQLAALRAKHRQASVSP